MNSIRYQRMQPSVHRLRRFAFVIAILVIGQTGLFKQSALAQERDSRVPAEYETVVSAVQKVMGLLSDVTQRHATEPINDQILAINDRLTLNGPVTGGFRGMQDEDLIAMLREIERDLESISRSLDRRGEDDLSRRLDSVLDDLEKAIDEADDDMRIRKETSNRYEIRNGRERVSIRTNDDDWWDEDDRWERRDDDRSWKRDRDQWKDEWRDSWKSGGLDS